MKIINKIAPLLVIGGILAGGMTANAATPVIDGGNIEQSDCVEILSERREDVLSALKRVGRHSCTVLTMLEELDTENASDAEIMEALLHLDIEVNLMKMDTEAAKEAGSEEYADLILQHIIW